MMFLQYFGLGAWIVPFARFLAAETPDGGLGLSPSEVGVFHAPLPVAGMFAPFVVGFLADRFFAAEKLLGVLQFGMAGLLAAAAAACDNPPGSVRGPLLAAMAGYALLLMPSITLTNVIALRNLENPALSFGRVRLVGTFGWIVSGVIVAGFLNPVSPAPLILAAGTAFVLGGLAFFLPYTPPPGTGRKSADPWLGHKARFFGSRAFLTFAVASLVGNMMNQFYTLFAARQVADLAVPRVEATLTIAQWTEMGCMAVCPWLVRRFGLKPVMVAGLLAWVLRNALFAWGSAAAVVAVALPMHGVSYVFFTVAGTLFVDRQAPPHLRAGAQALVTFLTSGPAVLAGYAVAGATAERVGSDWSGIWAVPTAGCAGAAVAFALLFRSPPAAQNQAGARGE
jgi:nucleoside transporter